MNWNPYESPRPADPDPKSSNDGKPDMSGKVIVAILLVGWIIAIVILFSGMVGYIAY